MKVIVDSGKKKEIRKINNEIFLCVLPNNFFLLAKSFYKKFIRSLSSETVIFYCTETLIPELAKKISKVTPFTTESLSDIFFLHINKIIKTLNTGRKMKICIFSDIADERIIKLCDEINAFCEMLFLVSQDENFYEKTSDYTLENYGLVITLKQFKEINRADINIILNSKETDFSEKSGYTVNLSDAEITAKKLLNDIIPTDIGDFSGIKIKKCQFLTEKCENFNLIWRNSQKSVDKFEK